MGVTRRIGYKTRDWESELKARCEIYRRNGRKHFLLFLLRVSFRALESERERTRANESAGVWPKEKRIEGRERNSPRCIYEGGRSFLSRIRMWDRFAVTMYERVRVWTRTRAEGSRMRMRVHDTRITRDGTGRDAQWETFTCRISSPRI